jgi:hypothetical protein
MLILYVERYCSVVCALCPTRLPFVRNQVLVSASEVDIIPILSSMLTGRTYLPSCKPEVSPKDLSVPLSYGTSFLRIERAIPRPALQLLSGSTEACAGQREGSLDDIAH